MHGTRSQAPTLHPGLDVHHRQPPRRLLNPPTAPTTNSVESSFAASFSSSLTPTSTGVYYYSPYQPLFGRVFAAYPSPSDISAPFVQSPATTLNQAQALFTSPAASIMATQPSVHFEASAAKGHQGPTQVLFDVNAATTVQTTTVSASSSSSAPPGPTPSAPLFPDLPTIPAAHLAAPPVPPPFEYKSSVPDGQAVDDRDHGPYSFARIATSSLTPGTHQRQSLGLNESTQTSPTVRRTSGPMLFTHHRYAPQPGPPSTTSSNPFDDTLDVEHVTPPAQALAQAPSSAQAYFAALNQAASPSAPVLGPVNTQWHVPGGPIPLGNASTAPPLATATPATVPYVVPTLNPALVGPVATPNVGLAPTAPPTAANPAAAANFFRWLQTLPTYNGIGDPTSFIDRYRMLSTGMSERDKLAGLMYRLTDHAASWLYRLPADQISTADVVLEQLQLQFQESKSVRMDKLDDMEFRASDNLPSYIRNYARLALTIPNTTGEDQAHKFISSLNPELRKQIRLASQTKPITSLQEAFICARNIASILGYDLSDEPRPPVAYRSRVPQDREPQAARVHFASADTFFDTDDSGQTYAVAAANATPPGSSNPSVADAAQAVYTSLKTTNAKLSTFGTQLTNVESKIDIMNGKVTTLDGKVSALDSRVELTESKIKAHDQQLTSLAPMLTSLQRIEASVKATGNSNGRTSRPGPRRFDTPCPDCGGNNYSHTADQCFVTHPELLEAYQKRQQARIAARQPNK